MLKANENMVKNWISKLSPNIKLKNRHIENYKFLFQFDQISF
jgi:hypothetical protein